MGSECVKCKFCLFTEGKIECHRFPPVPNKIGKETTHGTVHETHHIWPEVAQDDWCGEFQNRKDE